MKAITYKRKAYKYVSGSTGRTRLELLAKFFNEETDHPHALFTRDFYYGWQSHTSIKDICTIYLNTCAELCASNDQLNDSKGEF